MTSSAPDNRPTAPRAPLVVERTPAALRAQVDAWRRDGLTVGFAPTMGALHEGHLSLIDVARAHADRVVASIFVNPKQFAPHEDLATYPRDEVADLEKLASRGCDVAYLPRVEDIYPPRFATAIRVEGLSDVLCGASRPHFFGGVATILCKLLNQCRPDAAVFGEKDFQQLLIIRRMVEDLNLGVDIIGAPIAREPDGLAMSSRNAYLGQTERTIAARLHANLIDAVAALKSGARVDAVVQRAAESLTAQGFNEVDYFDVRSSDDLSPLGPGSIPVDRRSSTRVFAAAILGRTRLIDNVALV